MNKTLKELNLEDDFLFAKVMSDKEICKELLEKILEIDIEKVEMVEEQKTIDLLFDKGRHKYTFQNVCLEDNSIMLNDDAQKIILNTKGSMNDLSEELLEFLKYVESSTDDTVKNSKGNLVKSIHRRVQEVKNDISVEVEFMTLLERDREKIEEGREKGREETIKQLILKQYSKGLSIEYIAEINEFDVEYVRNVVKNNTNKINNY